MKTISVSASRSYNVLIGSNLLPALGQQILTLGNPQKIAIISDSNVWPLYGEAVEDSLTQSGFQVVSYIFPAGEFSKNGETYLEILNFLAENRLTRSDWIVALGGGVVGDLAGFAAATYHRGIHFVQVPTTLLAAVDSSVGGKTAIDLSAGKNLAGAFYPPSLVLCDLDTLNTLPHSIFADGCAEVIKYGILYDAALFDSLLQTGLDFNREEVIARCVELKRNVVMEDEFDIGARMKLNLGHTIGHGVEAKSNFTLSHGKAVAIGMAITARAACALGICTEQAKSRIIRCIERFGLPTQTDCTAEELYSFALSDKKRSGSTVSLIVPEEIGSCLIQITPVDKVKSFIKAGL